jgi:hypothetical protein
MGVHPAELPVEDGEGAAVVLWPAAGGAVGVDAGFAGRFEAVLALEAIFKRLRGQGRN